MSFNFNIKTKIYEFFFIICDLGSKSFLKNQICYLGARMHASDSPLLQPFSSPNAKQIKQNHLQHFTIGHISTC